MATTINKTELFAAINDYSKRQKEEELRRANKDFELKQKKLVKISSLFEDVSGLLDIASAMINNNVPLDGFETDKIQHKLGFFIVKAWKDGRNLIQGVYGFGVAGGGCYGGSVMMTKDSCLIYIPDDHAYCQYVNSDMTARVPNPNIIDLKYNKALKLETMECALKFNNHFWYKIDEICANFEQFKKNIGQLY